VIASRSALTPCILAAALLGCRASAPQHELLARRQTAPAQAPTEPVAAPVLASAVIAGPPTFSPDGNTAYFTQKRAIVVAQRHGDTWTEPEIAPFSGRWSDSDPAMAPDGSFLIFVSNRPAVEPGAALDGEWGFPTRSVYKGLGANLWRVNREGEGWGPPKRLPDTVNRGTGVFEPSIVADGSLYFMDAHLPGRFRIYRSQYKAGAYQEPDLIPFSAENWSDWDATVAPDESFMVFASDRPPVIASHGDDLFIAFRKSGSWGQITHLGPINDPATGSVKPRLGPDHHTLYFMSDRETSPTPPTAEQSTPPKNHIWQVDLAPWLRN
jgi:WD40-like Beta Propeller Repeat